MGFWLILKACFKSYKVRHFWLLYEVDFRKYTGSYSHHQSINSIDHYLFFRSLTEENFFVKKVLIRLNMHGESLKKREIVVRIEKILVWLIIHHVFLINRSRHEWIIFTLSSMNRTMRNNVVYVLIYSIIVDLRDLSVFSSSFLSGTSQRTYLTSSKQVKNSSVLDLIITIWLTIFVLYSNLSQKSIIPIHFLFLEKFSQISFERHVFCWKQRTKYVFSKIMYRCALRNYMNIYRSMGK